MLTLIVKPILISVLLLCDNDLPEHKSVVACGSLEPTS